MRSRGFRAPSIDLEQARIKWRYGTPTRDILFMQYSFRKEAEKLDASPYDPTQSSHHPFEGLPELECARLFIDEAIRAKQQILIYGDFDCDGITSVTLMRDMLLACGVRLGQIHRQIPHRIIHGYGLSTELLDSVNRELDEKSERIGLLIAVDCGTNDVKTLREVIGGGCRVLVVDHHEPNQSATRFNDKHCVMLNPKLWLDDPDQKLRFQAGLSTKDLCAAGLVYLLAAALVGQKGSWNRERALLLAGLATCADVMPLHGINRRLLKESLKLANQPDQLKLVPGLFLMARRPNPKGIAGGQALSEDVYYPVDEETYGFDWGPCLNAPGRMSVAKTALKLLEEDDRDVAFGLMKQCRAQNQWRQATTMVVLESAMQQARKKMPRNVLLLRHPEWHPGVVGIVAARIKDACRRPTFVCSKAPDGSWRGSGRSLKLCEQDAHAVYHMGKKLQEASGEKSAGDPGDKDKQVLEPFITKGGGHEMAGGLGFSRAQRLGLQAWLHKNSGIEDINLTPEVEARCSASILGPAEWGKYFEMLKPFGNGNPCPPLLVERAALLGIRVRTRVRKDIKNLDKKDGLKLKAKSDKRPKSMLLAPALPELWAYEGEFLDVITGRAFFAVWPDLEMAEYLWEINDYFHHHHSRRHDNYTWGNQFKLHLQLRSYVPSKAWSKLRPGQKPKLAYNFQILQCCPIEPLPIEPLP